jgi:hypothetical protein
VSALGSRSKWVLGLVWALVSSVSFGQSAAPELSLNLQSQLSPDPLTTEKVWTLAPDQTNPHRQRWLVHRKIELAQLKIVPTGTPKDEASIASRGTPEASPKRGPVKEGFRVESGELRAVVTGFMKGPGPWYQTLDAFPCGSAADSELASRFATEEGTRKTVTEAVERAGNQLTHEKAKLTFALQHIRAATEPAVMENAHRIFREWLALSEQNWQREKVKLRKNEWAQYEKAARTVCKGRSKKAGPTGNGNGSLKGALSSSSSPQPHLLPQGTLSGTPLWPLPWKDQMEPIQGEPPKVTQMLVRAPARLWSGIFSIRVTIRMGDGTLNGRFLIDSTAPTSVVSPIWLEGQGILPALVEIPRRTPQRVFGSQFIENLGELSKWVSVDRVEISGFPIPLRDFLLAETEFFGPPNFVGPCCDGVLGQDFLKLYPLEFQAKDPAEVRIWPKENFHWGRGREGGTEPAIPWIEVSTSEKEGTRQDFVSDCQSGPAGSLILKGVRWNLGSEDEVLLHTPWKNFKEKNFKGKSVSKSPSPYWKVECSSTPMAQKIIPSFPAESQAKKGTGLTEPFPAVDFGMALLSRGNFTVDLPHGRLWFDPAGLSTGPVAQNQSGLNIAFDLIKGERVLKVLSLKKNSPAQALINAGLKPGMVITQIDGLDPTEQDLWTLERHLAGGFGNTAILRWQVGAGVKIAPMKLF